MKHIADANTSIHCNIELLGIHWCSMLMDCVVLSHFLFDWWNWNQNLTKQSDQLSVRGHSSLHWNFIVRHSGWLSLVSLGCRLVAAPVMWRLSSLYDKTFGILLKQVQLAYISLLSARRHSWRHYLPIHTGLGLAGNYTGYAYPDAWNPLKMYHFVWSLSLV